MRIRKKLEKGRSGEEVKGRIQARKTEKKETEGENGKHG